MRKLISFMHISLDGFVAGPNGEMNWIKVDQEIFDHVGDRTNKGNAALYGKTTYEMMEGYWPTAGDAPNASKHDKEHSAWYKKIHKIVLSKTLNGADLKNTTVISDNIPERINAIKNETEKSKEDILIFGSPRATHALMKLGLIDGYWLFVNPVILGEGIRLFVEPNEKVSLELVSTHRFKNGVVELNYTTSKA